MRLEIANYPVERAVSDDATRLDDRTLGVDLAGLRERLAADARLADVTVDLVAPGESVRLARLFDLVEPRVKVAGPSGDFPGVLTPVRPAGSGLTHALKGLAVTVCDTSRPSIGPVLDVGGAGAVHSDYARLHHLVIGAAAPPDVPEAHYFRALMEAELSVAVELARATLEHAPAEREVYDLPPLLATAPAGLPRVGYIYMVRSQQRPTFDDEPILYGSNVRGLLPTVLHPNEVLDGAVLGGYWLFGTETYAAQNHPVIRALAARHGRDLWLSGVIATIAPATGPERERTVSMAVHLAADVLGLDGVVITKTGGGMPETDLMLLAEGCEQAGVKTALVAWERLAEGRSESPLTVFSPRADAIASLGDRDVLVTLPPVERVIGGQAPADAAALPIHLYEVQGAVNQLGASHWTTVDR